MDSARVVHVLDVVWAARRDLADVGRLAAELVDSLDVVFEAGFDGHGHVEDGVRAAAHRHVEDHRVVDRVGVMISRGGEAVAFAELVELEDHFDDPFGRQRNNFFRSAAGGDGVRYWAGPCRGASQGGSCCWR